MKKFSKSDLEKLIDEGELYNAQMKMKATLFRLKRKKAFPVEGQTILEYLKAFNAKHTPEMDTIILELIDTFFQHIPSPLSNVLAKSQNPLFSDLLNKVNYSKEKLRLFMKINKDYFNSEREEYCSTLAMEAVSSGDYNTFQQVLMLSKFDREKLVTVFDFYLEKLTRHEKNLALLRYVFYLMINKKMKSAYNTFEAFKEVEGFGGSDEMRILEFLLFAIRSQSDKCFLKIEEKYAVVLDRDSTVRKMFDKVGSLYCGIQQKGGFDILGMMQGLLGN